MDATEARELLLVLAGAVTATLTILAAVWWIVRPRWDQAVLAAAQRLALEWKNFFEELFKEELKAQETTHERARRTHEAVDRLTQEVADFRREVEPKMADMVIFTKTVADLDTAVRELNRTLTKINESHQQTREELAELRGGRRARGSQRQ